MFNRTPIDVIKSLRRGQTDRTSLLTTVFSELKEEVKSPDFAVKANAVKKLFVLSSEGYDMEWASFHILELMSSKVFAQKRTGLICASQCFRSDSNLLVLTTNLFRKDLISPDFLETCAVLNCLSCVITADLARELLDESVALLSNTRFVVRKKVVSLFLKIFLLYPEALETAFVSLVERLRDDHPGVVAATVNTIFELARHHPKYVLFTAEELYKLLLSTHSN